MKFKNTLFCVACLSASFIFAGQECKAQAKHAKKPAHKNTETPASVSPAPDNSHKVILDSSKSTGTENTYKLIDSVKNAQSIQNGGSTTMPIGTTEETTTKNSHIGAVGNSSGQYEAIPGKVHIVPRSGSSSSSGQSSKTSDDESDSKKIRKRKHKEKDDEK
jgi:hypothetical protein